MATLKVVVDSTDSVDELNEADNEFSESVFVTGTPDSAEAAEYAAGGYLDWGVVRGTKEVVRNLHSIYDQDLVFFRLSGTGGATDEIVLAADETNGPASVMLFDEGMTLVARGEKEADNKYHISLDGLTGGGYHVLLRDGGSSQNPSASRVYTLTIVAPDAAGANLVAEAVSPDAIFIADGSVEATATVKNRGDQDSGLFSGGYYLSLDRVIDQTDTLLATANFTALAADAEATDEKTLDLSGLAPGTYYLGFLIDAGSQVAEPVETDNAIATRLVVLPETDAREGNDTLAEASVVSVTDGAALIEDLTLHHAGDVDIFSFTLHEPTSLSDMISISYESAEPSLQLTLLDGAGNILGSVTGYGGTALLSTGSLVVGKYFIRVAGAGDFAYSTGYALNLALADEE
jgi:hypothetical protein